MLLRKRWTISSMVSVALLLISGTLIQAPASATSVINLTSADVQSIMAGETIKFTGTVGGGRVAKTVHAQQQVKNKWTNVAAGKLRAGSVFAFSQKVTVAGNFKFRLVYSAGGQTTYSKAISAHVRRWYYLSDRDVVEGDRLQGGSGIVNGKTYAHSVFLKAAYRDDWNSQWNLQRKCTVLQAKVGLEDSSESTQSVSLQVFVDQSEGPTYTLSLGHDYTVNFDIRGGLRLGVVGTEVGGNHWNGGVVLGNARIACLPLS